jgi:hypothetical protein
LIVKKIEWKQWKGGREGREWLGDEKNDKECNGKRMAERIG